MQRSWKPSRVYALREFESHSIRHLMKIFFQTRYFFLVFVVKTRSADGWQSGWMQRSWKPSRVYALREFESHSIRHLMKIFFQTRYFFLVFVVKTRSADGWQSGWMQRSWKPSRVYALREFESHSIRHFKSCFQFPLNISFLNLLFCKFCFVVFVFLPVYCY